MQRGAFPSEPSTVSWSMCCCAPPHPSYDTHCILISRPLPTDFCYSRRAAATTGFGSHCGHTFHIPLKSITFYNGNAFN